MLRGLVVRGVEGIDVGRCGAAEDENDVAQPAASGGLRLFVSGSPNCRRLSFVPLDKGDAAHSAAGGLGGTHPGANAPRLRGGDFQRRCNEFILRNPSRCRNSV